MVSEWTITTLKEHYDQRFFDSNKAVDAALIAVKEENRKSETGAEKRFDLLNELRDGVATKEQLEALEKVVNDLGSRVDRSEGTKSNNQVSMNWLYALVVVAVSIIALILK